MALRLASDVNANGAVIRGVRRNAPHLDLVRLQDIGMATTPDPEVLEWAAGEGRVVLTSDRQTMIDFAYDRVRAGQPMAGLLVLRNRGSIRQAIDDIVYVAEVSDEGDLRDQVLYIPL
jgi:hypothetical protein